jgi:hypothetical protein
MAGCDNCGTTILFGGKRDGALRYCSARCLQAGLATPRSMDVPEGEVQASMWQVYQGSCPKCGGTGPVDIHMSYRIWSAIVVSHFGSRKHVCCRPCGVKYQLGDAAFSLLLGWWGFPWGLLVTPVQIGRNLMAAMASRHSTAPSPALEKAIRAGIAQRLSARSAAAQ